MDLSDFRKSYDKKALLEQEVPSDPMNLFHRWFCEARETEGVDEPNAMTISTIGLDGFPKARVVLLKKYDENGFVFYTHYTSEKGRAMAQHPQVCLSFFWPALERQIIIKGNATSIAAAQSEAYFYSRPRGSQLGALVSHQSEVVPSRDALEQALHQAEQQYEGQEVPKPEQWGGYAVQPISVEFWQGRPNRLHDRLRYRLADDFDWVLERLAP